MGPEPVASEVGSWSGACLRSWRGPEAGQSGPRPRPRVGRMTSKGCGEPSWVCGGTTQPCPGPGPGCQALSALAARPGRAVSPWVLGLVGPMGSGWALGRGGPGAERSARDPSPAWHLDRGGPGLLRPGLGPLCWPLRRPSLEPSSSLPPRPVCTRSSVPTPPARPGLHLRHF